MCAMVLAYVSAIQDISLSPVLMSGAGTSMPGPGKGRRVGEGKVGQLIKHGCTVQECTRIQTSHNEFLSQTRFQS